MKFNKNIVKEQMPNSVTVNIGLSCAEKNDLAAYF